MEKDFLQPLPAYLLDFFSAPDVLDVLDALTKEKDRLTKLAKAETEANPNWQTTTRGYILLQRKSLIQSLCGGIIDDMGEIVTHCAIKRIPYDKKIRTDFQKCFFTILKHSERIRFPWNMTYDRAAYSSLPKERKAPLPPPMQVLTMMMLAVKRDIETKHSHRQNHAARLINGRFEMMNNTLMTYGREIFLAQRHLFKQDEYSFFVDENWLIYLEIENNA